MKKIKIIHLFNSSIVGGPEKAVLPGLAIINSGQDITCSALFLNELRLDTKLRNICPKYSASFGIPTETIQVKSKLDFSTILELREFIIDQDAHILHAHDVKATFYALLATIFTKVELLSTFHGFARRGFLNKIYEYIYIVAIQFTKKLIILNNFELHKMKKRMFNADKIVTIPNGIDTKLTTPPDKIKAINKIKEHIPHFQFKKYNFCTIGRLSIEKDQETLIKAISLLTNKDQVTLTIIGNGPLEDNLKTLTHDLNISDHVFFPGYIENASELLPSFDAFILPSLTEGISISILESCVAKTPTILSDIPGARAILPQDNFTNYFKVKNADDLAKTIQFFLKTPLEKQQQQSDQAYARVKNIFSLEKWAKETKSLYSELIS